MDGLLFMLSLAVFVMALEAGRVFGDARWRR